MPAEETKRALVVVRTYPVPDESGIESSCIAAITDKGEWLRLFPVPWRLLAPDQKFRKYQWVDFNIVKANNDPRQESHHLRRDGIKIMSEQLSTGNGWQLRKDIVLPLRAHCLCCLTELRDVQQFPTLGIIRPAAITRLRIAPDSGIWTNAQLAMLRQQQLRTCCQAGLCCGMPHARSRQGRTTNPRAGLWSLRYSARAATDISMKKGLSVSARRASQG